MPDILDPSGAVYRPFSYETEADFEAKVISLAEDTRFVRLLVLNERQIRSSQARPIFSSQKQARTALQVFSGH